jgi:hypothetical protein
MHVRASEIVSVAVVACAGAIVSALYTYTNRNRELDIELVKIGIGILCADPKETQTNGAREWAIQVIETYSRLKFSPDAKRELLQDKLGYDVYDFTGGNWSTSGGYGDDGRPIRPLKSKEHPPSQPK